MKIRQGGGGIDKDGNAYTLPEREVEVSDDYWGEFLEAMRMTPPPTTIVVRPSIWEVFKRAIGRR